MKLTIEKVVNGFIVTDEDGCKWIALENEYESRYSLTVERVLRAVLSPPANEEVKAEA